jgi:hypothetical protein
MNVWSCTVVHFPRIFVLSAQGKPMATHLPPWHLVVHLGVSLGEMQQSSRPECSHFGTSSWLAPFRVRCPPESGGLPAASKTRDSMGWKPRYQVHMSWQYDILVYHPDGG